MHVAGFRTDAPEGWNKAWLLLWAVVSVALIVLAFVLTFQQWALLAAVGFGVPEAISLIRRNDAYPPLTHTIRHFLPSWLAFTLIYCLLGSIGATWLRFDRPFHLGALFGLLGWLTDHFSAIYTEPDPHPFTHDEAEVQIRRRRMPL
ncbi:MAG: hypothetical protein R3320_14530 [Nitriliruptorales bacterium]|nr:hypothetical protein [Nitriliruptorales bacterium]